MNTKQLNDQELVCQALRRTGGNQSVLAGLMEATGVPVRQPSIHRWARGRPIVRNRTERRAWLEDFVRRTKPGFRVRGKENGKRGKSR